MPGAQIIDTVSQTIIWTPFVFNCIIVIGWPKHWSSAEFHYILLQAPTDVDTVQTTTEPICPRWAVGAQFLLSEVVDLQVGPYYLCIQDPHMWLIAGPKLYLDCLIEPPRPEASFFGGFKKASKEICAIHHSGPKIDADPDCFLTMLGFLWNLIDCCSCQLPHSPSLFSYNLCRIVDKMSLDNVHVNKPWRRQYQIHKKRHSKDTLNIHSFCIIDDFP